ncbi:MAG: hypothetical protein IJS08_18235 [Victivallales bacterium]|nr:hypothetical protein [Victivallales bacterium]
MKMNMMFKTISSALLILFLANGVLIAGNEQTGPVDGEQLFNNLLPAMEKKDYKENMFVNTLSKIHIKDVLKLVPVNSKGETGASVQPDVIVRENDDNFYLTLGVMVEFDIEKYKQNVMTPLREMLKQISDKREEEIILKSDKVKIEKKMIYGNISCTRATYVDECRDIKCFKVSDDQEMDIILNVLPKTSCIFESTYEGYKLKLTRKMEEAIYGKMYGCMRYTVHLVFKDDEGRVIAHGDEGHRGFLGHGELFIGLGGCIKEFPMLISPEMHFRNFYQDRIVRDIAQEKDVFEFSFKINKKDASVLKKIKSYEFFIDDER